MPSSWGLIICWCLISCSLLLPANAAPLFVLFLDGLRWDYPLDPGLPNFASLRSRGASVIPLRPVYPSLCVPNIYSIFTGLYPHQHGLVGNENFDPHLNATFNMASAGLMSRLESGPALWDSLARRGGRSLLYYLPGCASGGAAAPPAAAACARPYRSLAPLAEVRDALVEGARAMRAGYADLVVLYVDLLDWSGHRYGPDSATNRRRLLRQADVLVGLAAERVLDDESAATAGSHLLVVGAHGMASVSREGRATLEQFAMHADVARVAHVGAAVGVWPAPGRNSSLWETMNLMQQNHPHVEVLTDAQLIGRFYPPRTAAKAAAAAAAATGGQQQQMKKKQLRRRRSPPPPLPVSSRLPPISMLVEVGHFMETFDRRYPSYASGPARGWHGYDPGVPSMHTAALLAGPRARPGVRLNATDVGAESLDLHPLLRTLLGLSEGGDEDDDDGYGDAAEAKAAIPGLLASRLLLSATPAAAPLATVAKPFVVLSAAAGATAATAAGSCVGPLLLLLLLSLPV